MPIDGLVSGLDTNSIITQLMDIERKPRDLMATRRDNAQAAIDAFKTIETKLAAVTSAAADLQRASGWNLRTATTSATDVVTASVTAGASQGRSRSRWIPSPEPTVWRPRWMFPPRPA